MILLWIFTIASSVHILAGSANLEKRRTACMIDLVLLVDQSGSIIDPDLDNEEQDWAEVKTFLEHIVNSYDIGEDDTKIALVTFANKAKIQFGFGANKTEMLSIIRGLGRPFGQTFTADAINMASALLSDYGVYQCTRMHTCRTGHRWEATNVVLLVTDGLPTKGLNLETISDTDHSPQTRFKRQYFINEAVHRAEILRGSTDAKILALGVTDNVNNPDMDGSSFLEKVVDSKELYFKADDFEHLIENIGDIKQSSCRQMASACNLDVAFAVDMSGSVDEHTVKAFLTQLVHELYDEDQRIHTSLIRFANRARVFKYLDAYDPYFMAEAIRSLTSGGYTATAKAIELAKDEVFQGMQVGDRDGRGNVLVIITDGMPTVKLNGERVEEYASAEDRSEVNDEVMRLVDQLKQERNVMVISVVVEGKKGKNIDLLSDMSSETQTIRVSEFTELMEQLQNLKQEICQEAPAALKKREVSAGQVKQRKTDELQLLQKLIKAFKEQKQG